MTPYPKDGINDHVVAGAATVNPDQRGTKAAWWYHLTVPAGGRAELRLRLPPVRRAGPRLDDADPSTSSTRSWPPGGAEADEFYAAIAPADTDERADAGAAPGVRRPGVEQADVPVPA